MEGYYEGWIVYSGSGDLNVASFMNGLSWVPKEPETKCRDAVYAWLIVARRLGVARGVDRLVGEYVFRMWEGMRLSFRGSGITSIPVEVSNFNVSFLDVSNCKMDGQWPEELARCGRLKGVFASFNRIVHVPLVLSRLPYVETLNLGANMLKTFEAEHVSAPRLRHLYLSNNELSYMPDLCAFTSLGELLLDKNKFTHFPEGVATGKRGDSLFFECCSL